MNDDDNDDFFQIIVALCWVLILLVSAGFFLGMWILG